MFFFDFLRAEMAIDNAEARTEKRALPQTQTHPIRFSTITESQSDEYSLISVSPSDEQKSASK